MPVRSLASSVLRWPDAEAVSCDVRAWARKAAQIHPDAVCIGYFGSYARGDWGVGSDLDLVVVVEKSDLPFDRRAAEWDTKELPVPSDVVVYTQEEWESLPGKGRFGTMLRTETVWVYKR